VEAPDEQLRRRVKYNGSAKEEYQRGVNRRRNFDRTRNQYVTIWHNEKICTVW
jgi:hypothetical protein